MCDQCATDLSNGWVEPATPACCRVMPYNLDGRAGVVSATAGSGEGCRPRAAAMP